jgi:hypothetical protein
VRWRDVEGDGYLSFGKSCDDFSSCSPLLKTSRKNTASSVNVEERPQPCAPLIRARWTRRAQTLLAAWASRFTSTYTVVDVRMWSEVTSWS